MRFRAGLALSCFARGAGLAVLAAGACGGSVLSVFLGFFVLGGFYVAPQRVGGSFEAGRAVFVCEECFGFVRFRSSLALPCQLLATLCPSRGRSGDFLKQGLGPSEFPRKIGYWGGVWRASLTCGFVHDDDDDDDDDDYYYYYYYYCYCYYYCLFVFLLGGWEPQMMVGELRFLRVV